MGVVSLLKSMVCTRHIEGKVHNHPHHNMTMTTNRKVRGGIRTTADRIDNADRKDEKRYVMTMMYNDDDVLKYMYNYLCTSSAAAATTVVFNIHAA